MAALIANRTAAARRSGTDVSTAPVQAQKVPTPAAGPRQDRDD
jgi:hypothetical protein